MILKLFFTLTFLVLAKQCLYAQTSDEALSLARSGYELEQSGKMSEALYQYNKCIAADPKYAYPVQRIAAMYQKLHNYTKAIEFYNRAITLDSTFDDYNYLNLALSYKQLKKFDSSLYAYRNFIRKMKPVLHEDSSALRDAMFYTNYLEKSAELRDLPKNTDEPELVSAINSSYWDFAPSIRADGNLLMFTSRRPSTNDQKLGGTKDYGDDIFYSLKDSNGVWSAPVAVPAPVNSHDDEGVASLARDGQTVFFSICRRPDGSGDCDLYFSQLNGTTFSQPTNLGRSTNSREWDGQPSISADGGQLYFSSKRRNSQNGSEDIWVSYKNSDGSWGMPVNLGDSINTPMSERSPFLAADGKTLYFSSNGHPGFGDHDLFVTRKQPDGSWSTPENLGSPINTSGEDEYLTIPARGEKILYSSQRDGSDYNIYEATLPLSLQPVPVTLIAGHVYDKITNLGLGAKIEVTNLEKDELLATYNSNSQTGEFFITLPIGFEYGITATASKYAFYSQHYTPPDTAIYKEISYSLFLTPIDTNQIAVKNDRDEDVTIIPLNNIFFDLNKATLRVESQTEMNHVVTFLREYPKLMIEISGHTDSVGTDAFNKALSQQRADAVREYILKKGIAPSRVRARGYGSSRPLSPNDTEENRQRNRRTDFRILNTKK